MLTKKRSDKSVIELLRFSVVAIVRHPLIIYPFCIWISLQLLVLEVLYFSLRWPLSAFFAPIIRTLYSEAFLHYPFNFVLLPKLFHYSKMFLDLFLEGVLIATSMMIVASIDNERRTDFWGAFRRIRSQYVHILAASLILNVLMVICESFFDLVQLRTLHITSSSGPLFILKQLTLVALPYFNILVPGTIV